MSLIGKLPSAVRFHGATVSAETVSILPYALSELSTTGTLRVGCALVAHESVSLLPMVPA